MLRHAQILDDVRMVDLAEEATLSLEQDAVPWPSRVYDVRVEEFGRAGQLSEHGLTHLTVCPCAECLVAQNANCTESEGSLPRSLFSHLLETNEEKTVDTKYS